MADIITGFTDVSQMLALYAGETTTMPTAEATTLGTAPTTFSTIGYAEAPQNELPINRPNVFSIGSKYPVGNGVRRRIVTAALNLKIGGAVAQADFLNSLLDGATPGTGVETYKGLVQNCLYLGSNNGYSDGQADLVRYVVAQALQLSWQDENDIRAAVQIQALGQEKVSSPLTATHDDDIAVLGQPLSFANIQVFTLGGTSFRGRFIGGNVNYQQTLTPEGTRYDAGDNSTMTAAPVRLVPSNVQISGELMFAGLFNDTNGQAVTRGAAASSAMGDVVIGANDAGVGGTDEFNVTIGGAVAQMRVTGSQGSNMITTLRFEAKSLLIAGAAP